MSFDLKNWAGNIAGTGYTGAPKNHNYKSTEALATIAGSGYFNTVESEIDTGDVLYVYSSAVTGGGGKHYVLTNSSGTVTAAALT